MKNQIAQWVSKVNSNHVQMVLAIVVLALLVIGAGAPEDFGGIARR